MKDSSLAYACLPGIGRILDPQPEHYRQALATMEPAPEISHFYRQYGWRGQTAHPSSLRGRLEATMRKLEWTPARLRKARAA